MSRCQPPWHVWVPCSEAIIPSEAHLILIICRFCASGACAFCYLLTPDTLNANIKRRVEMPKSMQLPIWGQSSFWKLHIAILSRAESAGVYSCSVGCMSGASCSGRSLSEAARCRASHISLAHIPLSMEAERNMGISLKPAIVLAQNTPTWALDTKWILHRVCDKPPTSVWLYPASFPSPFDKGACGWIARPIFTLPWRSSMS